MFSRFVRIILCYSMLLLGGYSQLWAANPAHNSCNPGKQLQSHKFSGNHLGYGSTATYSRIPFQKEKRTCIPELAFFENEEEDDEVQSFKKYLEGAHYTSSFINLNISEYTCSLPGTSLTGHCIAAGQDERYLLLQVFRI